MKMPKRLLVASGPMILGRRRKSARHGGQNSRDQCGDTLEISAVLQKSDEDAEQPEHAAARLNRWNRARRAGLAIIFFSVVASTTL